jgi:thiol-disulfide isomerase/thioredoxin
LRRRKESEQARDFPEDAVMSILVRQLFFGAAILLAGGMVLVTTLPAEDAPNAGASAEKPKENPYIPRKGKSVEDLQAYIEQMQEAPASIRSRPGFAEGMAVSAQRILDTNPQGALRTFAVVSLLDAVHQWADNENSKEADARLAELVKKYSDDSEKKVSSLANLYALELRVLKVDDLDLEKVPALLDEVEESIKDKTLDAKHLRLASATVHAINRLKDDAEVTKRQKEFGEIFAASSEPTLSRYGKQLSQAGAGPGEGGGTEENLAAWIGKTMELTGTTAEGTKFELTQYKGKVVVVDFWATWCPPCRALLPELKETYAKFHAKGLEIVGVDLDRELSALTEYLDQEKIEWVNLLPEEKEGQLTYPMADKYAIRGIPTTFVIGRDGKIAMVNHGEDLAPTIEKLLTLSAQPDAKPADAKAEAAK